MFIPAWSTLGSRRRWRLLTAVLSLCALLFTQSAIAAYACPGVFKAVEMAQMADAGMPCAEAMADAQPTLCHAHCQSAAGTLDQSQPVSPAALLAPATILTVRLPSPRESVGLAVQPSVLRTSASPPLAVMHCCFRI
ncbi:hypothetical protein FN976_28265 [Caenimonas sedimenti]|uniref:Copper resistance protein n=1 Tax=Caenimonas sedimenti TaxID=2596921 RepID=A0A562ZED1_9BURK|nr:hypothetical protein [Caenimonas sedimenti]TWO64432.1 hypothetical protein FN976_28265 [Caenimonas sedimenti]